LAGGDLQAGSSAYRYSFMPISDFLTNVDFDEFYETALTLERAVEYSNCRIGQNPPVQAWDDSGCRCVRQCDNGGELDLATCTCKCRGNAKQGWTGPTCSEAYGSCQAGVGTGNPGQRLAARSRASALRGTTATCASRPRFVAPRISARSVVHSAAVANAAQIIANARASRRQGWSKKMQIGSVVKAFAASGLHPAVLLS